MYYFVYCDLPRNSDIIQIIMAITTTTAITPTTAPALKMPPITEQLLRKVSTKQNTKKPMCFFMIEKFKLALLSQG